MATYAELQKQIEDLKHEAERVRAEEMQSNLEKIRGLMAQHGITLQDLNLGKQKKAKEKTGDKVQAKYADENGNTWSGRGRMPAWIVGGDKAKFLIK